MNIEFFLYLPLHDIFITVDEERSQKLLPDFRCILELLVILMLDAVGISPRFEPGDMEENLLIWFLLEA